MKQENQLNWGIIGCGDVCEVKSGPAFNKVPNAKLLAVMRRNEAKVKDYATRHDVPLYYTDGSELINNFDIHAIYIATPPSTHEHYTMMALKAGKPVYVEKPVSTSATSVMHMMELEKKYNGKVVVAHYRRSLPLFIKIKELIANGTIGKVKTVLIRTLQSVASKIITHTEENWRINPELSGGGLFNDLSPHQLDILYWLFGEPEQSIVTATNQGKLYKAPDNILVQLYFKDDISFSGVWNFNVAKNAAEEFCEIIGSEGKLKFAFFSSGVIEVTTADTNELIELSHPVNIQQPHIANVTKFFRGEGENPCSLADALITMKIIDKANNITL